jgi:hypothetical protein
MNRTLTLLAALGIGVPAIAQAWTVEGVDMDAVPWATLCPEIKAVELRTGAGSCATVHPASYRHAKWDGFGMGVKEPQPNCKKLEKEYRRFTSPRAGTTSATKPADRWGNCIGGFTRALEKRASESERFAEPFEQWRQQYFGGYIQGEG